MASKVDLRLLCIFMVADRVDCPGSWRFNRPLAWFLQEVRDRQLLNQELQLDDGPPVGHAAGTSGEVSSGAALMREEVRWIKAADLPGLPLVSEDLRPILQRALSPATTE